MRVCILAQECPYVRRQGSTTYLDHLARCLAATGAELHLRIMQAPRAAQIRLSLLPGFLAPYASVALRGSLRAGDRFYARDPRHWVRRLAGGTAVPPTGPWTLAAPDPAGTGWAAAEIARLAPDWVIANYFNAAEAFGRLPAGPARGVLVHDVFALRRDSQAALGQTPDFDTGMITREAPALGSADLALAIKEEEAAHIRRIAPGTAAQVLPFAVEIPGSDLSGPRPPVALFVGARNGPNIDALAWLLEEIWPLARTRCPQARLRVIGRVAEHYAGPWPEGAEPVGFVESLTEEYAGAAVALAPIRFGSGVKIKLVEALAHGLPGIATPAAAEGLAPLPDRVLRIAATGEAFADALCAALSDPEADATRAAARTAAGEHYARDAVAARLADGLRRVQGARRTAA